MYFCTELARQNHPVAALITEALWENSYLFNQVLWPEVDACIRGFQKTGQLEITATHSMTVRNNILTILLCIQPQLPVEQLVHYAKQLSITAHDFMALASLTERFDCLTHFFNTTVLSACDNFSAYRGPCYDLFLAVCKGGQLSTLDQLLAWMPVLEKQVMLAHYHEKALDKAIKYGHYSTLLCVLDAASISLTQCLTVDEDIPYDLISNSVHYGQIAILDALFAHKPDQVMAYIKHQHSNLFELAAMRGHLATIQYLLKVLPMLTIDVALSKSNILWHMVSDGGDKIVDFLLEHTQKPPEKIQAMITKFGGVLLYNIITGGNVTLLQRLAQIVLPETLKVALVHEDPYGGVLSKHADKACLDSLQYLLVLFQEKAIHLSEEEEHFLWLRAAKHGHLQSLEFMFGRINHAIMSPSLEKTIINGWSIAACNGHMNVLQCLYRICPQIIRAAIIDRADYSAFLDAVRCGRVGVMDYLVQLFPDQVQAMIEDNQFIAFRRAMSHGQLAAMLFLLSSVKPEKIGYMLSACDFEAVKEAVKNGHILVVEHLLASYPQLRPFVIELDPRLFLRHYAISYKRLHCLLAIAPTAIQHYLCQSGNYDFIIQVFRGAELTNHSNLALLLFLLDFTQQFAWAEMHDYEYGHDYIYSFVSIKLRQLRDKKQSFETQQPNGVFTIDQDSAHYYFYIFRNLIRRNNPNLLVDMQLLLSIPAIHALVASAVTPNRPNELLILANDIGNLGAAGLLLTIPAVRDLAAANDFYRHTHGAINLRDIANDPEASMRELNPEERKQMAKVQAHYKEMLPNEAAHMGYFNALRVELEKRYLKNPASIKPGATTIQLPLDYEAFDELIIQASHRALALEAYYQHSDHTALRYLSRPNRWMAADANFVRRENGQSWSTFEQYIPLIALLYVAVSDPDMAACDGHTKDSRVEHFIRSLALIGRAHNWDKSRFNERTKKTEHYEDLEGDKPSCFGGVLRRLLQSVLGHPLLCLLTHEVVEAELRDLVRAHFQECWEQLGEEQQERLRRHYDDYSATLNAELLHVLCAELILFNLPHAKQEAFLHDMQHKWEKQWSEFHTQLIRDRLHVSTNGLEACHAQTLGALGDFVGLITKKTLALQPKI